MSPILIQILALLAEQIQLTNQVAQDAVSGMYGQSLNALSQHETRHHNVRFNPTGMEKMFEKIEAERSAAREKLEAIPAKMKELMAELQKEVAKG